MNIKIYHLSSCSTCQRIIRELQLPADALLQDIKTDPITADQLDGIRQLADVRYEDLFSRKALKYRALGLHEKTLTETDYRQLILEEYTFLKRPVVVVDDKVFIGNTAAVTAAAHLAIHTH